MWPDIMLDVILVSKYYLLYYIPYIRKYLFYY